MPMGVPLSKEKIQMVRQLKARGLTCEQIAVQTRLAIRSVEKVVYRQGKYKEEDNGR